MHFDADDVRDMVHQEGMMCVLCNSCRSMERSWLISIFSVVKLLLFVWYAQFRSESFCYFQLDDARIWLKGTIFLLQLYTVDLNNADDCASKFRSNSQLGFFLFLSIVAGTLLRKDSTKKDSDSDTEDEKK